MISPYGCDNESELVNLYVENDNDRNDLIQYSKNLKKIKLDEFVFNDLILLSNGSFTPLETFMSEKQYVSVLETERLPPKNLVWTIPILLHSEVNVELNEDVALIHPFLSDVVAMMKIEEVFAFDPFLFMTKIIGSDDDKHPFWQYIHKVPKTCVSGKLQVLFNFSDHMTCPIWIGSPLEVRNRIKGMIKIDNNNVIAFQTRNPMHRAHEELVKQAALKCDALLLIHPTIGKTKDDDIDWIVRSKCHVEMYNNYFDKEKTILSFLQLSMRMAGPKEAILHAIVRRNYGASHFIVGRDHAGPGSNSQGNPFYGEKDAQEKCKSYESDLGVKIVISDALVFDLETESYVGKNTTCSGQEISGTQVREYYLKQHIALPAWFSRPEVATILQSHNHDSGFCLWLTGLPCSGKTTLAVSLKDTLPFYTNKKVVLLDGDEIRKTLCKDLGFSKKDRCENVYRIAFVASCVVQSGGIVLVSSISPYRESRVSAKEMIRNFIEIYLSAPVSVCQKRDVKGFYESKTKNFTGVDDPFEEPGSDEYDLKLDTQQKSISQCCKEIISYLIGKKRLSEFKNVSMIYQ